ncbi:MAG: hypothetical protein GC149_08115 [Gammaproteobacteria bacterium]|nr:hypothetical protein [Gammaproteobacteria bacterium]
MSQHQVLPVSALEPQALQAVLNRYQLQLEIVANGEAIPGSFWGDSEAGLIANRLIVRPDTPAHSLLHEACHYICMSADRRAGLHTNAGGDYDEENAVCYLQILLAADLPPLNPARLMADMDAWGYSFRLGSARAWFEQDAQDAREWLARHGLIGTDDRPTGKLRND